jgi:hypothetical protein
LITVHRPDKLPHSPQKPISSTISCLQESHSSFSLCASLQYLFNHGRFFLGFSRKKYFKSFVYLNEFYLELPLQESERVWRIVLRVDRKNHFLPRSLHFFSARSLRVGLRSALFDYTTVTFYSCFGEGRSGGSATRELKIIRILVKG